MRTTTMRKLLQISVLAAVSATVMGGLATPSQAAEVKAAAALKAEVWMEGTAIRYRGTPANNNVIILQGSGNKVEVLDVNVDVAPRPNSGCVLVTGLTRKAVCTAAGNVKITGIIAHLGDGNDNFESRVGLNGAVFGQGDSDLFLAGASLSGRTGITYSGGTLNSRGQSNGVDTVSYAKAGVLVSAGFDRTANDGRVRSSTSDRDLDNVSDDVERLEGSDHDDALTGNNQSNVLIGGKGRDTLQSLGGADQILAADNTADALIDCGAGSDDLAQIDAGRDTTSNCER
ncbi:hypothetical protein [Streptosporangium sp. OZ121]|uniref:hypothetical protein n=1 Tax=Streptosporangium sp. OZ121 TaxID=3444183 RepID=UPI003F792AA7